jgi:general secretion pathway protein B
MSFILDALKKSEVERQRQAIPGLIDSRPPPPRARFPIWAIALTALLGVNLLVLAIVLTRGGSKPEAPANSAAVVANTPPPPSPAAAPPSAPPAAPPAALPSAPASQPPGPPAGSQPAPARSDHFSPMDPAPVYAPELPVTSAPPVALAPPAGRARTPEPLRAARTSDPLLTHEDSKADTEVLPSMSEVNLNGQLPELHIDVHVYATNAAERFVYINMRKYREGETIAEGPVLERIRRDGAVLNYQGVRFLLPRQQ